MNEIPIPAIAMMAAMIALAAYFIFSRRGKIAGYDKRFSQYRSGELAQRLGLTLTEGDPDFNLYISMASDAVYKGPKDSKPVDVSIRMTGERDGVPTELVYLYRVEQKTGMATVTHTYWFECRMSAFAKEAFPPFEVVSKNVPMGPIATKQALPATPTGNDAMDALYSVSTKEPRMAQELGKLLGGFDTFKNSGIHLIGDGRTVSFMMNDKKAPLLANALYYPVEMADQLSKIARAIGG